MVCFHINRFVLMYRFNNIMYYGLTILLYFMVCIVSFRLSFLLLTRNSERYEYLDNGLRTSGHNL